MSDKANLGIAEEPGGRLEVEGSPEVSRPVGDRPSKVWQRGFTSSYDLQGMFYNSGVASVFLDESLNIRFFTAAAQSVLGISAASIGRPLADLGPVLNDPTLLADLCSVIETHRPRNREVEGADGIWFMRRALSSVSGDNRVDGVVITYSEISEQKAAAREIDAARAYSDGLVNTLRRPMAVLDNQLKVLFANPAFYATFNTDAHRTIGRNFGLLDNPLTASPALHVFLDSVKVESPPIAECEIEVAIPAGGHRQFLLRILRIEGHRSTLGKLLFVGEDVTERNRVAAALEAAMLRADEANRGKSHFLAAASHDLRQPLQTMSLLRSLLATRTTDRQALGLLVRLENTISVMSGILNTLLDINQLESGTVCADPANFSVNEMLQRLKAEFAEHMMMRGLEWRVIPCSSVIHSDPRLLAEMLRNLISNAVKYTKRGKVLLGCKRRGNKLRIEVWDTGIGVPEAEISTVFDEFHQLDNAARERSRGLGLGLPIVRRLALLLGHDVDVGSVLGKGSCFAIEVPLRPQCSDSSGQKDALTTEMDARPSAGILVIDDDPEVRGLLELVLRNKGHRVTTVGDALQALAALNGRDTTLDLVIADYNLPGSLNGLEITARLRQAYGHELPAIILTGDISKQTLDAIGSKGCVRLTKPVKVEELERKIALALFNGATTTLEPQGGPSNIGYNIRGSVFVIDDEASVREPMRELLEAKGWVAETYATCEAFLQTDHPGRKGCVLVDARLPGMNGLDLVKQLNRQRHRLAAIMVTGYGDIRMAVDAIAAGALDFIEKPADDEELIRSVQRAFELMEGSFKLIASREAAAARAATLTARQRQIMTLVLTGQPSKNIATDLRIGQRTVENHRAAIMKKMGASSIPELVRAGITALG